MKEETNFYAHNGAHNDGERKSVRMLKIEIGSRHQLLESFVFWTTVYAAVVARGIRKSFFTKFEDK